MSNDTPLVTVLIATYNKSATLRYALQSVLWQTLQDFEVLVIGDACTDDSESVVNSFQDPRIQWHNLPTNSGYQSVPHNEGLKIARGKYIAYLNQDDLWLPQHLELLVIAIEKEQGDFAYSILEWIQSTSPAYEDIPQYPGAIHPPEASATLHRASIVQKIGYWKLPGETKAIPRVDYFHRAQFAGMRFVFVPRLTVLKFDTVGGYDTVTSEAIYAEQILIDPHFLEKELARMLVRSSSELAFPPSWPRIRNQWKNRIRRFLNNKNIEPANLIFWHRKGFHLRKWRRVRKLG